MSLCGTHSVLYEVFATSVRQAYALAGREVWAAGQSLGARRIYSRALSEVAPYMGEPLGAA